MADISDMNVTDILRRRMASVDETTISIARYFLDDVSGATAEDVADLAMAIQVSCEDACRAVEARPPKAG